MQKFDFKKVEATSFSESSPVKCLNIRRTFFLKNTSWGLLLPVYMKKNTAYACPLLHA